MKQKKSREQLKRKVKKLKTTSITYQQTKKNLKSSLSRQKILKMKPSGPEMAVEVLDQKDTDEQVVERALIAEHIFRKTIEESIPSGISAFDMDGHQIYVNRVFCKMVGWSEKELIGTKYPFKYWPPEEIESVPANFQSLLGGDVASDGIELPFRRKNGDRFWGLVLTATLTDSKGKIIGQLMSVADISAHKRAEKALRALSSKLIGAQERERKLVSQDLHDSIGGKLTGIKYSLEKIISDLKNAKGGMETSLKEVLSIVQSLIEETQRISKHLHPSILDDLGLLAAMRGICREFREIYAEIEIKLDLRIHEHEMPELLKTSIFRILQEALNNIAKHSGADIVTIFLEKTSQRIELTIKDNGKGFDLNDLRDEGSHQRGLGLQSIRERTELFRGTIDIRSKKGKGTTIHAAWPCQ